MGPKRALEQLRTGLTSKAAKVSWAESARQEAILGSCRKSLPSVRSGIRLWRAFAADVLGMQGAPFPPTLDGLLVYSSCFRCAATYGNYLTYARVGCLLAGKPDEVFDSPVLKRAKGAVLKRLDFKPREKMFVRLDLVRQIVRKWNVAGEQGNKSFAMWVLTAYVFLLRCAWFLRCFASALFSHVVDAGYFPNVFLSLCGVTWGKSRLNRSRLW